MLQRVWRPAALLLCAQTHVAAHTAPTTHALTHVAARAASTAHALTPAGTMPLEETAIVAGGCFWCVEGVFNQLDAVKDAESGYIGGGNDPRTANYKAVCEGDTGHAEAVMIKYDPSRLSYSQLLSIFFATHDPTQLNRQGNDVGTQYRSAIFYLNPAQKEAAAAKIAELQAESKRPIATTLEPGPPTSTWFPAEEYHQHYSARNPTQGYVAAVAVPKMNKAREKFPDLLKPGLK
jgi:peptide-methionine (S)-S-oxide reductase